MKKKVESRGGAVGDLPKPVHKRILPTILGVLKTCMWCGIELSLVGGEIRAEVVASPID